MAGAAGGPKWLILSALDRYIFGDWLARSDQPVALVGSSIGAWRFAAACHPSDPAGAIADLERGYVEQRYSDGAGRDEITATVRGILEAFFSPAVRDGVLQHPRYALHAITVRSRGFTASERRGTLAAASGLGALANAVSRRTLGAFFERVVFARDGAALAAAGDGLPTRTVALSSANARDAVYASGNIPLLMRGVVDPAGAPPGVIAMAASSTITSISRCSPPAATRRWSSRPISIPAWCRAGSTSRWPGAGRDWPPIR